MNTITPSGFDIIGDLHGHYTLLLRLLRQLGYEQRGTSWRHPAGRQAIFVGDLIDRGPQQVECVRCVRAMVETGDAHCILGNHEYNAILHRLGWRQLKSTDPHHSFLEQAPRGSRAYDECLDWFWQLPAFLHFGNFGVIHACWDERAIHTLRVLGMGADGLITARLYSLAGKGKNAPAGTDEHAAYDALENILKGWEMELPDGVQFVDADGTPRHTIRTRWWDGSAHTWRQAVFTDGDAPRSIPDTPLPGNAFQPIALSMPTFIGHYWRRPTPKPTLLSPLLACVDYSAGAGGPLAAYRWNAGDTPPLRAERLSLIRP